MRKREDYAPHGIPFFKGLGWASALLSIARTQVGESAAPWVFVVISILDSLQMCCLVKIAHYTNEPRQQSVARQVRCGSWRLRWPTPISGAIPKPRAVTGEARDLRVLGHKMMNNTRGGQPQVWFDRPSTSSKATVNISSGR